MSAMNDLLNKLVGKVNASVKTEAQSLTPEQQAQARKNIGAISEVDVPQKGVDYWTPADQEAIVQDVITALGTPVFGRVDENNHIALSGHLANGTYTLSFEDADGFVVANVGTIEKGETMPDSGEVELTWSNGVNLDKTTGAEGAGEGYTASQYIEIAEGYEYTISKEAKHGSCGVCNYDVNGGYLGYDELWAADSAAHTEVISPRTGAATIRLRVYSGTYDTSIFTMTFKKKG